MNRTSSASVPADLARVDSIDILRALTMVLMIFVNDLWSLQDIPAWLEHVERGVDGIGLADMVFPAFLFIVGLSLPFALDARRRQGDSTRELLVHVLSRSIALLVMGVFLVNGESYNELAAGMPRVYFYPLCCASFILVWNAYPKTMNKKLTYVLKGIGVATLVVLAIAYRGGDEEIQRFAPHWWGILGLIGWAYLASGLVTIFARNNFYAILGAWIFFAVLSMVSHAGYLPDFLDVIPDAIRGGTLTGLTLGGVLTALVFQHFRRQNDHKNLTLVFVGMSVLLIVLSVLTRPYWGLAKLGATPAWLFLCSAFTILAFTAIYWIVDVAGKANWFALIRPAGAGTLLCYLIPYFAYAFTAITGIELPAIMLAGGIGLIKSFLFAVLCAVITGWLMRAGIRLKI
jgi:predicted acyltransferase